MADDLGEDPKARFDAIRQVNPYGEEYWSARDLQPLLGYDQWRRFEEAIDRAKAACINAGEEVADHIAGAGKMIGLGKGAQREVTDYAISRFGCYLVAMNGDPRKPEIAAAQGYFVSQTQRMERWDAMREQLAERVHMRQELTEANKRLSAVAKAAGVNSRSFGRLHDAGYRGLYGGMSAQDIKTYKGIPAKDDLPDRMGTRELAANLFVRTQTEGKIANEGLQGEATIAAHHDVGSKVRQTIAELGGTPPEDLPAEPSIRPLLHQQARRRKSVASAQQPSLIDSSPDEE